MGCLTRRTSTIGLVGALGVFLMSCGSDELSIGDNTAGLNGGFETTETGYPVNWAFFPNPESDSTIQIVLDSARVVEGAHSLQVVVRPNDRLPVLRSRRFSVEPGRYYRLSGSFLNEGCHVQVNRIVQNGHGNTDRRRDLIVNTSASSPEWATFEETISVAADEGNVLLVIMIGASGTVWFDDVKIEELTG